MRGILLNPVSGNFVVVDHDILWSYYEFERDKFEFKAPRAECINYASTILIQLRSVSFYIHVGHIPNEHDLAKDEHLDPINVKIAELREVLESVTAEQKYLKARGSRHRH
ncbi:hypothetical protein MKW92_035682, partial [Papaver armeniacum]